MKMIAYPSTQAQSRATECKKIASIQRNLGPPLPSLVAPLSLSAGCQKTLEHPMCVGYNNSLKLESIPTIEAAEPGYPLTDK